MTDEKYFYEYIRLLDNLITIEVKDFGVAEFFCEYISSNPAFKYNGTYLRDSLADFKENLAQFKQKRNSINKFHENLSKNYASLGNWYIIIDNLYIIKPDKTLELLLDFSEITYFKQLMVQFNLYKYKTDYITIRYIKGDLVHSEGYIDFSIENEYVNSQKIKSGSIYKEIELNSMVKKSVDDINKGDIGESNNEK